MLEYHFRSREPGVHTCPYILKPSIALRSALAWGLAAKGLRAVREPSATTEAAVVVAAEAKDPNLTAEPPGSAKARRAYGWERERE